MHFQLKVTPLLQTMASLQGPLKSLENVSLPLPQPPQSIFQPPHPHISFLSPLTATQKRATQIPLTSPLSSLSHPRSFSRSPASFSSSQISISATPKAPKLRKPRAPTIGILDAATSSPAAAPTSKASPSSTPKTLSTYLTAQSSIQIPTSPRTSPPNSALWAAALACIFHCPTSLPQTSSAASNVSTAQARMRCGSW